MPLVPTIWHDPKVASAGRVDGTERPPKRVRTEDLSYTSVEPLARDELLYFEDGNVVIVAEKTAFRVHRGQLSRHSEVLTEKLASVELTYPEKYDGCPVVQLHDGVEAVRDILKALYDGFSPNSNNRACLRNILVLSTKYKIRNLREKVLEMLLAYSPDTLEKLTSPCVTLFPHPCYTLLLALETNSRCLLPAAYYNVSRMPLPNVLEAMQGNLAPSYWMSLIKGKNGLADWMAVFLNSRLPACLHQSCSASSTCQNKILEIRKFYLDAATQPSHVMGSLLTPQPFQTLMMIRDQANSLCPLCHQSMKEYISVAMQVLWTQLPAFFDLEPWDELRN